MNMWTEKLIHHENFTPIQMTQVVIYKVLKFGYNQKELEGLVIKMEKKLKFLMTEKI